MSGRHTTSVTHHTDRYADGETDAEYYYSSPRRRGGGAAVTLVIILVLILAALVGLTLFTNYLNASNTILPGVMINDISVGGMTRDQAMAALAASGIDPYADASITVNMPLENSFTVTAEEVGLKSDLTEIVVQAYSHGRGSSTLDLLRAWLSGLRNATHFYWQSEAEIDMNALSAIVTDAVGAANEALSGMEQADADGGITIVKGLSTSTIMDAEAITEQVAEAFENRDFSDIDITPASEDDQGGYAMLEALYEGIYRAPVDAHYDAETGDVVEGEQGISFDMDAAKELWDAASVGDEIYIPLVYTDPEITADNLSEHLFEDLLSEKTTSLSGSSSARINNITLAAEALDGVVLNPGEEFDYNTCLGERTAERGYQEAGAYAGGQHTTAIGGGICQASSTLYYCALYANLKITVRDNHYFVVSYLPRGLDATVSWGGPDFRFVNSRDYPIKIRAWVQDGNLTVQIWGTDVDGSYVEMTSEEWEDSTFYYAQTYRTVYAADGTVISSGEEAYSRYYKYENGAAGSNYTSDTTTTTYTDDTTPAESEPTPAPEAPADETPAETPQPDTPTEPDANVEPAAEPEAPSATDAPVPDAEVTE